MKSTIIQYYNNYYLVVNEKEDGYECKRLKKDLISEDSRFNNILFIPKTKAVVVYTIS